MTQSKDINPDVPFWAGIKLAAMISTCLPTKKFMKRGVRLTLLGKPTKFTQKHHLLLLG